MTDEPKEPTDVNWTQEMIDAAKLEALRLRERELATAATSGQQHLHTGALAGVYGNPSGLLPEVQLRAQCLKSVIQIGIRELDVIVKTAQAFYDFMVDAKKSASLHVVKS